jgi:hypothetical protein
MKLFGWLQGHNENEDLADEYAELVQDERENGADHGTRKFEIADQLFDSGYTYLPVDGVSFGKGPYRWQR